MLKRKVPEARLSSHLYMSHIVPGVTLAIQWPLKEGNQKTKLKLIKIRPEWIIKKRSRRLDKIPPEPHPQLLVPWKRSEVSQLCPTLCDPMDCSLPGSSIQGILQARILEWVAISFSRRSSRPRDWTRVSRIVGGRFTVWATREALPVLVLVPWAK